MNILIDLDVPKWAMFFCPIIEKLREKNCKIIITSRGGEGYSELNEIIKLKGLEYITIGKYGGRSLENKLRASIERMEKLIDIVKSKNIDIVISGSVVDAVRVGFGLGLKVVNFYDIPLSDYRTNFKKALPQARLTIPLATKMFKPFVVPDEIFLRFGLEKDQIIECNFIDPLIWLKDFEPDINYIKATIPQIDLSKPIITIREEEFKASYVEGKYPFLYDALRKMQDWDVNLVIIPRYEAEPLKKEFKKAIVLEEKIILQHLLAFSDLFIGGGGTINIEATYFGVPTISTRSFISHYDKFLIDKGLMWHSNNAGEIVSLAKSLLGSNNREKASKVFGKMNVDIDMIVSEILN